MGSITARLIYLGILGVIAYWIVYLILQASITNTLLMFLSESINSQPKAVQWIPTIFFGFSLPWFLQRHRAYHTNHTLKNDKKNPPIYLASFASVAIALLFHDELRELATPGATLQFSLGSLAAFAYMRFSNRRKNSENEAPTKEFDIRSWLEAETPIENPNYDMLNTKAYAIRIEKLLSEKKIGHKKSHQIAIRGDFGSGKSSLCRVIENNLNRSHSDKYIFCYIDGWGRENKSFAGQIIEIIVDKIAEVSDASSLTQIPENYINALNGTGLSGLASLTHLIASYDKKNPEHHLKKISTLLKAIDYKLVAVIEDFDRGPEPENSLNELSALLERLKNLDNIHFIMCLKIEHSTIIDKVCTHVEDILPISYDGIQKITQEFIAAIEKDYSEEIFYAPQRGEYTFIPSIAGLIKTPRHLKKILRRTLSAWKNIKGEIYFYDLLHLNILRLSSTEIFSYLVDNFESLYISSKFDIKENNLIKEFDKLDVSQEEKKSLYATILALFGNFPLAESSTFPEVSKSLQSFWTLSNNAENKCQRIIKDPIYLRQAITESLEDSDPSDQLILSALSKDKSADILSETLISQNDERQYELHISRIIDWAIGSSDEKKYQKLLDLICREFTRLQIKNTSISFNYKEMLDWHNKAYGGNRNIYPLVEQICKILLKKKPDGESHPIEKLISEIIKHIASTNSSIAIEIFNIYIRDSHQIKDVLIREIENNRNINIFNLADPTDTKFIFNLYHQYCECRGIDNSKGRSFSSFSRFLFDCRLEIRHELLPMILFFLDQYLSKISSLGVTWDRNKLQNTILSYKEVNLTNYQFRSDIEAILTKWKKFAEDNEKPFNL